MMKQKLSIILFIFGVALIALSFSLRESYEKEMYQLYINQQKGNLVKGWNKNWKEFLSSNAKEVDSGNNFSLLINRNGKLIDKNFFPKHSKKKTDWNKFNTLPRAEKLNFLKKQFEKVGTWDRTIAIKKWKEITNQTPELELSKYESSTLGKEEKNAYRLLFKQLKKRSDYSSVSRKTEVDQVLINSNESGEIQLFIPLMKTLKGSLLANFKKQNSITGVGLGDNPVELNFNEDFNPLKFNPNKEKIFIVLGFLLIMLSVGFYLKELRNKRKELVKKVSFLNQLVHEVKTPITGIRLNSELLIKHGHDDELLQALLKSSNRLNEFFEDIVLINRNEGSANYSNVNVDEWKLYIGDILDEFKGKIELVDNVAQSMKVDKGRVRIILRNLLKNAIRYGKRGTCEAFIENGFLNIKVTDNGPGVSLEDASKIFQEFFRAKSAKNISPDGLGIGLSIVKNLAGNLKGNIELLNPGQKNASFLFKVEVGHES